MAAHIQAGSMRLEMDTLDQKEHGLGRIECCAVKAKGGTHRAWQRCSPEGSVWQV